MEERSQPRLAPHISGILSLCISINCLLCGLFVFRPKSGTTVNESEMDLCTKVITCPFNCNQYVPMLTGVVSPVKAECINKLISLLCFYLIVQHVSKITCTMIIISIFSGKVNFLMHPDACIDLDVCYLTLSTLHYDNNLMTRFSVL